MELMFVTLLTFQKPILDEAGMARYAAVQQFTHGPSPTSRNEVPDASLSDSAPPHSCPQLRTRKTVLDSWV